MRRNGVGKKQHCSVDPIPDKLDDSTANTAGMSLHPPLHVCLTSLCIAASSVRFERIVCVRFWGPCVCLCVFGVVCGCAQICN